MTLHATAAPVARSTARAAWARRLFLPFGVLFLAALAACNGSAVVTLTATPSTDTYLAYRVGLVSIQLQTSSGGKTAGAALPKGTTVDLARLTNLSEVVGETSLPQGNYSEALITLDYSSAQIVYDNGTVDGLALTPVDASGQKMGQVTLLLYLDPSDQLGIVRGSSGRLSLGFNLAASNVVNVAQKTVTVMPMIAASTQPLDSKVVRIRGPLGSVNSSKTGFTSDIVPFDFGNAGAGSLGVSAQSVTTFEINGTPSTGSAGMTAMAALKAGVMVEAFGTLTTSSTSSSSFLDGSTGNTAASTTNVSTCSDGTTPVTGANGVLTCADGSTLTTTPENTSDTGGTLTATTVNFSASQVLAGSSVQGDGFDRVSGIVTGRSGDTLTIDEGTLLTNEGANTLVDGTATVKVGPNTQVTQFGGAGAEANGTQDISVGSLIYAFGTASAISSSSVTLDASAGRARLGQTTASGLVTGQGTTGDTLTLNLSTLGGRSAASFDFAGTGTSAGEDASAATYLVTTANLTLTNATTGTPVQVTGSVIPFGTAGSTVGDLSGTALLDYTTINAELVMDYEGGTPAPFASYSTTEVVLDARNSAVGVRHQIQIGAQIVNIVGIPSDPIIVPNASATNTIFTIGHAVSGTYENFDTYSAFVTQLQTELNGNVLATGVTATGQYTANTYTFSASSITLLLNN
ncbi:MAG TPA: hypothetical protein VGL87_10195 [Steroidobacteraceae bacterium]